MVPCVILFKFWYESNFMLHLLMSVQQVWGFFGKKNLFHSISQMNVLLFPWIIFFSQFFSWKKKAIANMRKKKKCFALTTEKKMSLLVFTYEKNIHFSSLKMFSQTDKELRNLNRLSWRIIIFFPDYNIVFYVYKIIQIRLGKWIIRKIILTCASGLHNLRLA